MTEGTTYSLALKTSNKIPKISGLSWRELWNSQCTYTDLSSFSGYLILGQAEDTHRYHPPHKQLPFTKKRKEKGFSPLAAWPPKFKNYIYICIYIHKEHQNKIITLQIPIKVDIFLKYTLFNYKKIGRNGDILLSPKSSIKCPISETI